jgi:hypothetical protein
MTGSKHSEIHALTTAEIGRQARAHNERLRQIVSERAAMYADAVKNGTRAEAPVADADERAARDIAKRLLNGAAPESLSLPPEVSHDKILYREQRAIEIVLKILADKELVARTTEAVAWAEEHCDRWRALCRDAVLCAIRLAAVEASAHQLLEQCVDPFAVRLPMANLFGGRSISELPLSDLQETALAEGVVTVAEIRKAKNVE